MTIRLRTLAGLAAFMGFLSALPHAAAAQSMAPRLVHPADYGTIREVAGSQLLTATPDPACPARFHPITGGPCFEKVASAIGSHGRVLGLWKPAPAGERISGAYGRDFVLYDVDVGPRGVDARPLDFPTSNVKVPRDCYALPGEEVGYVLGVNGPYVARESQLVVCDGGARTSRGPYAPEGQSLMSNTADAWHRTEMALNQGDRRYLATPGACDPQYSLRVTWCAIPAIMFMQSHPDQLELDVVAAKHAVQPGDLLSDADLSQWVMKRKAHGFYPDERWFAKSMLTAMENCTPIEKVRWRVSNEGDGLYIREQALNRCGAPPPPVPADIYEAYGEDLFVADCADRGPGHWDDHKDDHKDDRHNAHHDQAGPPPGAGGTCFDAATDYLRHSGHKSVTVVVLNQHARPDDHLRADGFSGYDVARISLDNGALKTEKLDSYTPSGISMSNCSVINDGANAVHGFVLVRSMGQTWARAYQWMSCPVY